MSGRTEARLGKSWCGSRLAGSAVALAAALLMGGCAAGAVGAQPADGVIRVGLIAPASGPLREEGEAVGRGAELGAEEVRRAAELIGRGFELVVASATTPEEVRRAAERLVREGAFALVGGVGEESCRALGELAERRGVLFLNVGCVADALRREYCRRTTFHVQASAAMHRDALAQAAAAEGAPGGELVPVLWHPELGRYGAAQLNDRFRDRFGQPMDSRAWAGWVAVKILWEAALRGGTTEPARLVEFLESDRAQFDGHKGRPLSFRPGSHQLRQPLYLVADAQVVAEAPPGRPAPGQSSRDFLDQLGGPGDDGGCR